MLRSSSFLDMANYIPFCWATRLWLEGVWHFRVVIFCVLNSGSVYVCLVYFWRLILMDESCLSWADFLIGLYFVNIKMVGDMIMVYRSSICMIYVQVWVFICFLFAFSLLGPIQYYASGMLVKFLLINQFVHSECVS